MKRALTFLLMTVLVFAGAAYVLLAPFGPRSEVFVDIPAGTGTTGMAERLKAAGVIRSRFAFEAWRALKGGTLKAGEYRFDHPVSVGEVYGRIARGDVFTIAVVMPEGYNLFDVAAAVERAGLAPGAAVLAAAKEQTALIRKWSPRAGSLEGYMFPDTYRFSRHATPAIIVGAMVRRFGQVAERIGLRGPEVARTVNMASLVEREVHVDAERPLVAGVFENRLLAGMPLQTDPAVAYASQLRGTWTGVIHQSELHSDSPYNTYVHTGLPPGPICNPGVAALQAAMHPAKTPYLYFVAGENGSTRFARDLADHAANVKAYRRGTEQ